uniref:Uncharacterized protein n=1 Tax=Zea mays TaxID=4577 RepID=A0A804N3U8_MAIZE
MQLPDWAAVSGAEEEETIVLPSENLPRVSVVMPLKGFGEHNLQNWRTQITSLYGGPLEFLFIVESKYDPAYHVVSRLITEYKRTSLRAGPRGEQSPLFWGLSWLSFLSTHQLAIVVVSFEVIRTLKLEVIRTLKLGIRDFLLDGIMQLPSTVN